MGSMQTIEESKHEQDYSGTLLSNSDSNAKFGPMTCLQGLQDQNQLPLYLFLPLSGK